MHFQFVVAPPTPALTPPSLPAAHDSTTDLLRQLLEVQREQVGLLRSSLEAQHSGTRWHAFLARWEDEFPHLPTACRDVLPTIERAFLRLIEELSHNLRDEDSDGLESDFSVSEFLDRYAMRISQMGTILNLLGPLAEAARTEE